MEDLLAENASIESYKTNLDVKIRNTDVDLRHQFVYVPLVYSRETMDLDFQEMVREEQVRGNLPMAGLSCLVRLTTRSDTSSGRGIILGMTD